MRAKTNENNHSAVKKLIPAVAMLALSAVTLSTSTYAWFTMNKEVQMTGLNMTATTGEGMEISLAAVDTSNNITFSGATFDGDHPTDSDSETGWKSSVVVGNYYSDIGTLKPASSIDGVNLYDATDASNSGKTASKFEKITLGNDAMAAVTTKGTFAANDSDPLASTGDSGYYVDIPVHLRTSKVKSGESTEGKIYYKMIINNNNPSAINEVLYKAVRVAFIPGVNDTSSAAKKILTCDELTNYYQTGATLGKAVNGVDSRAEVTNLTKDSVTDATTIPEGAGADSGLTIPYAESSGTYGHLDFTVRVWLEGESTSCYDANAGQEWNISLAFSMGEFETA